MKEKPLIKKIKPVGNNTVVETLGYRFEQILGAGADGIVMKLRSNQTNDGVACKIMWSDAHFKREAAVFMRIEKLTALQPCIVPFLGAYDFGYNAINIKQIAGLDVFHAIGQLSSKENGGVERFLIEKQFFRGGGIILTQLMDGDLVRNINVILKNQTFHRQLNEFINSAGIICKRERFLHNDLFFRNILFQKISDDEIIFKLADLGRSRLVYLTPEQLEQQWPDVSPSNRFLMNEYSSIDVDEMYVLHLHDQFIDMEWKSLKEMCKKVETSLGLSPSTFSPVQRKSTSYPSWIDDESNDLFLTNSHRKSEQKSTSYPSWMDSSIT